MVNVAWIAALLLLPGGSMNAGRFEFPDTTGYENDLGGISENALGGIGSHGLLYGGSVDDGRIGALSCAIRDSTRESESEHYRDHSRA